MAQVPADMALLSTEGDAPNVCFIDTKGLLPHFLHHASLINSTAALDGETNLKIFQCHAETAELAEGDNMNDIEFEVKCDQPNSKLYDFDGSMQIIKNGTPVEPAMQLTAKQVLLRGVLLRNTKQVTGPIHPPPVMISHHSAIFHGVLTTENQAWLCTLATTPRR